MLRRNFFHMSCTRSCIRGFERKREAPDLPPRGRGTARRRWKVFSDAQSAYEAQEAYEAYEAQEPIFLKEDRLFLSGNFINRRFSKISSAFKFQNTLIR